MTAYQDLLTDLFKLSPYVGMLAAFSILALAGFCVVWLAMTMTVGHRIASRLDPLFKHLVEKRTDMYVSSLPFKTDRARAYCMMLVHPEGNLDIKKASTFDFKERLGTSLYFWARVLGRGWIWFGRFFTGALVAVLALSYVNLLRNLGLFRFSTDYFSYINDQLAFWIVGKPTRFYELVLWTLLMFLIAVTYYTRRKYLAHFQPFISQIAKIQLRVKAPAWAIECAHSLHLGMYFGFPHLYRNRVAQTGAQLDATLISAVPRGLYAVYGGAAIFFATALVIYVALCILGILQP